jgi:1,4-dihydroxy-2-naphthoate octaprenyltransferase
LPPGWPLLLPIAAIAGPAIHLANSLVDVEADARTGSASLATRLGQPRAQRVLALSTAIIYVLAWASLVIVVPPPGVALAMAVMATLMAGFGVALSWQLGSRSREAGWLLQSGGLALMSLAWVTSVAAD